MPDHLPPDVIRINTDDHPLQNHNNNNMAPPRPPPIPMMPMHQGDDSFLPRPPVGLPPGMPLGNPGMPPRHLPHPPADSIPIDLRPRQKVEVFDTRTERLTEADVREQLSSYVIVRLEKASSEYDVDAEGYPLRPTWQKATRTEITDLSKEQATRQVRDLERYSASVTDKKMEMSPPIQRQIEASRERLESTERDGRFYYILAQLDWQDQKIGRYPTTYKTDRDPTSYVYGTGTRNKRGKKAYAGRKVYTEVSRKSKSNKPKFERVSVTAYFKRTPRPEEDAFALAYDIERGSHMKMLPPPHNMHQGMPMGLGQNGPHPNMQPMGNMPPMGNGPPMGNMRPMGNGQPMNPGPNMPPAFMRNDGPKKGDQNQGNKNKEKQGKAKPKIIKMNAHSPQSSMGSMVSDDSWSDSESELYTPEPSLGSSSRYPRNGKRRDRSRGRSRHRGRPEHYGLEMPRYHSKHDLDFGIEHIPHRIAAPMAPRPLPLSFQGNRLVEEPFYDELDDRGLVVPRGRTRLTPALVHPQPPIRRLPEHEARRAIHDDEIDRIRDGLEAIRMEDDLLREREYQLEQEELLDQRQAELSRDRKFQERLRTDVFDDRWSPVRESSWPEQRAQQYMRRAERVEPYNPFSPAGRRVPYYTEGRRI